MTELTPGSDTRPSSLAYLWIVVCVGALIPTATAFQTIRQADWDPTVMLAFGEEAGPTREYAEARLGDVFLRPGQGHDGKYFFVQANDPFLLDPAENALVLDRPLHRSMRMLYPAVAGGLGVFGPETIIWSMIVVNILAIGAGTWAVGRIAVEMGGSAWWGLAFALNLGILSELDISGAGALAAAAAFAAVLAVMRGHVMLGASLLLLASLARETMLIVAAAIALWLWFRGERRSAVVMAVVPGVGLALWVPYLVSRIGLGGGAVEFQGLGWPFVGIVAAAESWLSDPVDLIVGLAMALLLILYTRAVFRKRHLVGWAFLGIVLLATLLTEQVWHSYFDISRALAPLITSFVLLVFLGGLEKREVVPEVSTGHVAQ